MKPIDTAIVSALRLGASAIAVMTLCTGVSGNAPAFGYIMPDAQYSLMQPELDRYADDLRDRLSTADSIHFVALKGGRQAITPDNCRKYGIDGFFQPTRRWRIEDDSVDVRTALTVTGCDGTVFYYTTIRRDFERDPGEEPQKQIDAATAEAATALAANFETFRRAHDADWKKLLANVQASQ